MSLPDVEKYAANDSIMKRTTSLYLVTAITAQACNEFPHMCTIGHPYHGSSTSVLRPFPTVHRNTGVPSSWLRRHHVPRVPSFRRGGGNVPRRKSEADADCRVLRMHGTVRRADDQRRLDPRFASGREIGRAHGREERDHRRLPFFEDDVAAAQQDEIVRLQRLLREQNAGDRVAESRGLAVSRCFGLARRAGLTTPRPRNRETARPRDR